MKLVKTEPLNRKRVACYSEKAGNSSCGKPEMPEEREHFLQLVCFSPVKGLNGERGKKTKKSISPDQEITLHIPLIILASQHYFCHKAEYTRLLGSKVKRIHFKITTVGYNGPQNPTFLHARTTKQL